MPGLGTAENVQRRPNFALRGLESLKCTFQAAGNQAVSARKKPAVFAGLFASTQYFRRKISVMMNASRAAWELRRSRA